MADPQWMEIFRSYAPAELDAHIAELKKQISVYTSQNVGAKGYTKNLEELKAQLSSAIRTITERNQHGNQSSGVIDFSRVSDADIPPRWP